MASFFFKRRIFVFLAFIVLIVSSNPIVGNYLMQKLEHPYKPVSMSILNEADAIVVLSSGSFTKVGDDDNFRYELSDADRFFSGIELLKKYKANRLIFTAGQVPWISNWKPEGIVLRDKAISLGLDAKKILVTKTTQNTYEESIALTELLPSRSSILLVTSAFHTHRSKYLFEKQGFKVTPFPVDFRSSTTKISIMSFLPNVKSLNKTSLFIRENIGRLYYKLFY